MTAHEALQVRRAELTAARLRSRRIPNAADRALSTLRAELRVRLAEARLYGLEDVARQINKALCIWTAYTLNPRHGCRDQNKVDSSSIHV